MTVEAFLANFGHLADAPNGVRKLRELIHQLAVQGKLVPQDSKDEPAGVLLERIKKERKKLIQEKVISAPKSTSRVSDEEVPFNVPCGWLWLRLVDLVTLEYGKNLPAPKRNQTGGVPVYGSNGVVGMHDEALLDKPSIIVGRKGSSGALNISRTPCWPTDVTYFVVPPEAMNFDYCYLLLKSLNLDELGKGIKPGLNRNEAYPLLVALPPLAEQHRIVSKIDQLMALCDELEARQRKQQEGRVRLNSASLDALLNAGAAADFAAHWQRICANFDLLYDHPDTIAKLRAAILQLAVQGKLVPQDAKDEPAEGTKSKKQVRATESDVPFTVPSSWVWKPLGELTSLITSGSRGWKEFYAESGATFIRSQDIKFDRLEYDQRAFVRLPVKTEGLRTRVSDGDLLITITGANVAKAALIEEDPGEAYVSQHVALIRLSKVEYGPYIHKWLIGECGGRRLLLESSYGAKPGLNLQNLRELPVPLPPLAEQHRIVAKVDQLMALCDALEAKLNKARQQSEKLMEATAHNLLFNKQPLTQKGGKWQICNLK